MYDIVVIGSGISGLAFANEKAYQGKKVLVLEANANIGGCLHTAYHTDKTAWVELGAHTFYNKYVKLIALLERVGLQKDVIARKKIPMRVFTHQPEKIFSKIDKWELFRSAFRLFFSNKKGKTVEQYFGNIVGANNYKKVFNRLFNAVIVQQASNFTAEYFLKSRKTRNTNYPKSFLLKNGMSSFITALATAENITVKNNFKAVKCNQTANGFEVQNQQGETVVAKDICFAATPTVNGNLLKNISTDLSNILLGFPMQEIESQALFLPENRAVVEQIMFLIPLQGDCFSMVTRDVFPHNKYRGFAFHFEQKATDKKQLIDSVLGVENNNIVANNIAHHKLPLLKVGHTQQMEKIKTLSQSAGVYLVGNYFNGLSLEDCVERALEEANR